MREFKNPFALDFRNMSVCEGDIVLYLENGEVNCRKVFGVRCVEGNYEVKVMGANCGWKRDFYKLAIE